MTRPPSGATSTDAAAKRRARMVDRQLRRRGIGDERVLRAMDEIPRELFVPEEQRAAGLPRRRAADRRGPDDLAAVDRGGDDVAARAPRRRARARGGHGIRLLRGRAVALLPEVVTIERHPSLAGGPGRLGALGYANVEVRVGDGSHGAPDRAPFDGISVTATAGGAPPPRCSPARPRRGRSSARSAAAATSG